MKRPHLLRSVSKAFWLIPVIVITASLIGCSAALPASSPTATGAASSASTPAPSPTNETAPPSSAPATAPTTSSASCPSPTPKPTLTQSPSPAATYTPTATPYIPTGAELDLFQYTLGLINKDRQNAGVSPVVLDYNAAAEDHARDMLANHYVAHWGTDGLKPYMRYTLAGGLNYEAENSCGSTSSGTIDVKNEIQALENEMMTDDAASNWAHRDNILNKWHKKVSLGIAFDTHSVYLVQEFEGDYVEFYQPPTISGNILSFSGRFTQPGMVLNNAAINYDPPPQPISGAVLNDPSSPYHHYGLDNIVGWVFPPPPPGSVYNSLPPDSVIAAQGSADNSGQFTIKADISSILSHGSGVYTVCLVPSLNGQTRNMTNYSIFVK